MFAVPALQALGSEWGDRLHASSWDQEPYKVANVVLGLGNLVFRALVVLSALKAGLFHCEGGTTARTRRFVKSRFSIQVLL